MGTVHPGVATEAPSFAEVRASARQEVHLSATVLSGTGEQITVEMTDISDSGCQVRKSAALEEGSVLRLTIPSFTSFAATVVWAEDDVMGLRFEKRLHPMILDQILSLSH